MNKKVIVFFALAAIALALIGCSRSTPTTPTTNPDLIITAANQTAEAMVTEIFASTPSATPETPTPTFDPVQTLAAQTQLALLTQSAALSPIPTQASATTGVTPIPPGPTADLATFVADVTIPDGTVIAPGAAFKKTWKLQNAGTTTWSTSYSFAYISGEKMGTVTSVPLAQSVAPGAQVEISVDMVAPSTNGNYQSYWKMKNASGQFFNESVYVLITVGSGGANPSATAGTPVGTVSPTSTGAPGNPITSLTMSVDSPTGPCPLTFTFTAVISLNQSATLTYKLEAGSDTPGFVFDLPGPQTRSFAPGTYSIPSQMTFTSTGSGWVRLHVTSPVDTSSNQATFSLTCTP